MRLEKVILVHIGNHISTIFCTDSKVFCESVLIQALLHLTVKLYQNTNRTFKAFTL